MNPDRFVPGQEILQEPAVPVEAMILKMNTEGLVQNDSIPAFSELTEKQRAYLANEKHESARSPSDYASTLERALGRYEEASRIIEGRLKGTVVVDLGAGRVSLYSLMNQFGASGYVGVDLFHASSLAKSIKEEQNWLKKEGQHKLIPHSVVQEDALSFLRRLPSASVSIVCSGLEIITNKEYLSALRREIERVMLPTGGVLIGPANFRPVFQKISALPGTEDPAADRFVLFG